MKTLAALVVLLFAVSGCAGSSPAPKAGPTTHAPDPGEVSRAALGKAWPLTVPGGKLQGIGTPGDCAVIFWAPDGSEYAVNGTAKDKLPDVRTIDAIWAKGKNISPLLQRGLNLCE